MRGSAASSAVARLLISASLDFMSADIAEPPGLLTACESGIMVAVEVALGFLNLVGGRSLEGEVSGFVSYSTGTPSLVELI